MPVVWILKALDIFKDIIIIITIFLSISTFGLIVYIVSGECLTDLISWIRK